jgi:hypothetical protein
VFSSPQPNSAAAARRVPRLVGTSGPRETTRSAARPPYWAIFPMLRPPARGTAGLEDRSRAPSKAPAGMPHRHIGRALSAGRLRQVS